MSLDFYHLMIGLLVTGLGTMIAYFVNFQKKFYRLKSDILKRQDDKLQEYSEKQRELLALKFAPITAINEINLALTAIKKDVKDMVRSIERFEKILSKG